MVVDHAPGFLGHQILCDLLGIIEFRLGEFKSRGGGSRVVDNNYHKQVFRRLPMQRCAQL